MAKATRRPVEKKTTLDALIRSVDPDFYRRKRRVVAYRFSGGRTFYEPERTG